MRLRFSKTKHSQREPEKIEKQQKKVLLQTMMMIPCTINYSHFHSQIIIFKTTEIFVGPCMINLTWITPDKVMTMTWKEDENIHGFILIIQIKIKQEATYLQYHHLITTRQDTSHHKEHLHKIHSHLIRHFLEDVIILYVLKDLTILIHI